MKLDTVFAPTSLADVPALARAADEIGFAGLWTAETSHDPYLPLALAAEHSERIELGTSIAVAFPRSPLVHAQIAWDLAAQSRGRFVLGLGTQVKGHNERRFGITWDAPGPRLREMILCIRAIWDCWQNGTKPRFEGKHYRFTLMTPFFSPGPITHPRVPIWIAGVNTYMLELAGELCEGLHVHPFHSIRYLRESLLPEVERGLARGGRKRSDIALATSAFVIAGDTDEEIARAKDAVRMQLAFYASTRAYARVLETHGWSATSARLNEKAAKGDWGGMASEITDEMLDVYAVTARWDEVAGRVRARYEGILDRVALYLPFRPGDDTERWRRIVRAFA
ncbi:MAG: TIGR03617 family F420-dependent LLM class oxidoreductase [Deltaproteobacteria bacterium]|nr:TIGR03617 family F420-dependent LLM class oxidoreductase [Deltaproteobacteria bacterium]